MKLILVFVFVFLNCAFGQVAVIANKSVPVDSISKTELLNFYSGDIKEWDNDKPVIVFDLKSKTDTRKQFFEYLGKSSSRMRSIWLKNVLSGEGSPPKALESEASILINVSKTPGAIGFVSDKLVDETVKILALIK